MTTSRKKPPSPRIVTLMTDFGESDGYAGSMKGVILNIAPKAVIVDITHNIQAFNVTSASYVLSTYCRDFPAGTVHVAVVDPGVGSQRKALAVRHGGQWFVAPDNGLLSFALSDGKKYEARELTGVAPPRGRVSSTFHGRDVFAPAAAHLALGKSPSALGPRLDSIFLLESALPRAEKGVISGEVIHIDRFGNLVTNIRAELLEQHAPGMALVKIATLTIIGLSKTYSDKNTGDMVAYMGSSDYLEIGMVRGSAAAAIKTPLGRTVSVLTRKNRNV